MITDNEQSLFNRTVDCLPLSVRKHIPLQTKSLSKFVSLLRYYEARHIDAELKAEEIPCMFRATSIELLGINGDFKYSTKLKSISCNGREIHYCENFGYRSEFSDERVNTEEKRIWLLRSYSTVNDRLQFILDRIPYISYNLFPGKAGNGLSPEDCKRLEAEIKKQNIRSFNQANPGK